MPEKQEDPGAALRAASMKEFEERTQGKPTPTQEENDRAKMGEFVTDKEPDGSKEEPPFGAPNEAQNPGVTRAMQGTRAPADEGAQPSAASRSSTAKPATTSSYPSGSGSKSGL